MGLRPGGGATVCTGAGTRTGTGVGTGTTDPGRPASPPDAAAVSQNAGTQMQAGTTNAITPTTMATTAQPGSRIIGCDTAGSTTRGVESCVARAGVDRACGEPGGSGAAPPAPAEPAMAVTARDNSLAR